MSNDHQQNVLEFLNRILEMSGLDLEASTEPAPEGFKI